MDGWIYWLIDGLTASVEPVDSVDVIGAHVPGSQGLVWVVLSEESRLAVSAEGVPF